MRKSLQKASKGSPIGYGGLKSGIAELVDAAKRAAARSVNALMTATYWEIGRRIVEYEQGGRPRASYGEKLLERLSSDLTKTFGRGFGVDNLQRFRAFFLNYPPENIYATVSRKLEKPGTPEVGIPKLGAPSGSELPARKYATVLRKLTVETLATAFPLPWSHYLLLIARARSPEAAAFYHTESLRGGWSVRQLQRQMDSQFYERIALSRRKKAMLIKGGKAQADDAVSVDEELHHPVVLEFLNLRDQYSETDLEDALITHLESFLLELGTEFAFVGRQLRLRIDDEWYRVDLVFFHRRLRCLVIFDLKLGRFNHADAGQMQVYLNYAREHWMQPGENPPIGVILCSGKSEALVRYATGSLRDRLLVREYLTVLPDEQTLAAELEKHRKQFERRK